MRTIIIAALLLGLTASIPTPARAESAHLVGAGANYLKTLGDIKDEDGFNEDSLSLLLSYQYRPSPLLKLEGDLELVPDYIGSSETLYQPQAYLLFGSWIYAGAGIGLGYIDGEWLDDPMYALRAGLDLPLGDRLFLDINANYRFADASAFDDVNSEDADAILFGAALRVKL